MKNNDTNMRKKYNRNLLINGFKAEFVKNLKKIFNTEDKELSFLQFLIKHSFIFVGGMIPIVIDFFKKACYNIQLLYQNACLFSRLNENQFLKKLQRIRKNNHEER